MKSTFNIDDSFDLSIPLADQIENSILQYFNFFMDLSPASLTILKIVKATKDQKLRLINNCLDITYSSRSWRLLCFFKAVCSVYNIVPVLATAFDVNNRVIKDAVGFYGQTLEDKGQIASLVWTKHKELRERLTQ